MTRASDRLLLSGGGIVFVCLVVVLIYQVLLPFLLIIWTSLKVAHPGDPEFLELSFTTANYFRAFAIRQFWEASLNTFYFASVSTLFSFVLGTFLAWTVVRTNTPMAQLIGMITLGRIIIPESLSRFPGSSWLVPA
jgi:ABC-type spermidine/putrescine transport system permease subunit II